MAYAEIRNDGEKTIVTIRFNDGRVTRRELNLDNPELVQKIVDRYIIDHNEKKGV